MVGLLSHQGCRASTWILKKNYIYYSILLALQLPSNKFAIIIQQKVPNHVTSASSGSVNKWLHHSDDPLPCIASMCRFALYKSFEELVKTDCWSTDRSLIVTWHVFMNFCVVLHCGLWKPSATVEKAAVYLSGLTVLCEATQPSRDGTRSHVVLYRPPVCLIASLNSSFL